MQDEFTALLGKTTKRSAVLVIRLPEFAAGVKVAIGIA
jgi:hypothetical protein